MGELERFYQQMAAEKKELEQKLRMTEYRLGICSLENKSIIVKKVRGKLYYYEQWRENGKTVSRYLAPALPGVVSAEENAIMEKQELIRERQELLLLKKRLEQLLKNRQKDRGEETFLPDYTFETYWKDELTARVKAQGSRVQVSRYTDHPVKQLFARELMTRPQLTGILELRCWDRNRADIGEILRHFGLEEYNPYEIVKKTHGVSYNDYNWFRFPGEKLTSQDVLVK